MDFFPELDVNALQAEAIARGLYGDWRPTAAERARLEQIFRSGVCDYARGDAGRPPGF